MLKVTTETGRVYIVDYDGGWFMRMAKGQDWSATGWVKTWHLMVGDNFVPPTSVMEETEGWSFGPPEVGKHMYIGGKDVWFLSTKVSAVEPFELGRS